MFNQNLTIKTFEYNNFIINNNDLFLNYKIQDNILYFDIYRLDDFQQISRESLEIDPTT